MSKVCEAKEVSVAAMAIAYHALCPENIKMYATLEDWLNAVNGAMHELKLNMGQAWKFPSSKYVKTAGSDVCSITYDFEAESICLWVKHNKNKVKVYAFLGRMV